MADAQQQQQQQTIPTFKLVLGALKAMEINLTLC
jgi:hypothetical protein